MESWQKSYIESKLDQLLEDTSCSVLFLAKLKAAKVLSSSDVQAIKAEKTEQEKADKLYDIIQTKVRGYEVLTKAVYECNQTGVLKILLDGFLMQNVTDPLTKCGIEIDRDKLLACKTEFQGQVSDFKNLLEIYLDSIELKSFLDGVQETDYIDLVLFENNSFVLAQNNIPPAQSYYVPRFISNRLKVNLALFKIQCRDIFVFKDIERYELSNIAEPNSTSTSSTQTENISSRFILWECDEDLRDIRALAKQSGTPVHVIKVENELITDEYSTDNESDYSGLNQKYETVYILEESNGSSDYLWRFVSGKQQCYMSEEEFIDQIEDQNLGNSKGFCICDTPGMGKTLLLQSIARKIFEKTPDRLVVFISLSHIKFFPNSKPLQSVLSHICESKFSCTTLEALLTKGSLKMDLFLDGFDEILEDMRTTARTFLENLSQNYTNVRLFVTSRPHMRRELEMSLGVIAYDISPFSEKNQLEYLTNIWRLKLPKSEISLLEKFAGELLNHVRSKFSSQEKDILGIPLQCYLLAEVNVKQAQKFAERSHSIDELLSSPTSIFQMYHEFMNQRFDKIEEPKNRKKIWDTHICAALDIFMPEVAKQLAEILRVKHKQISDSVLKLGIMETRYEEYNVKTTQFVHRTFAEFLVTKLFVNLFKADCLPQEIKLNIACALLQYYFQMKLKQFPENLSWEVEFLSNKVERTDGITLTNLRDFKFPILMYFLNGHLQKNEIQIENIPDFNLYDVHKPIKLLDTFTACACVNYVYIIKLLIACIRGIKPEIIQKEYHHILLGNRLCMDEEPLPVPLLLLNLAATFSEVETVESIVEFYENDCTFQTQDIYTKIPPWFKTPLQCALERGNYTIVEFFIYKMPFECRLALYHCIHKSRFQSFEIVQQKISICDMLLNKFPGLLTQDCYYGCSIDYFNGPLVCPNLHLDIIKHLIDKGADISSQALWISGGTYVDSVQRAAQYLSNRDFHSLCEFLIIEKNKKEYFQPSPNQRSPLLKLFDYAYDFNVDTVKLILSVNHENNLKEFGDLLLYTAVAKNCNLDTIKYLISSGADFRMKEAGRTLLHLAAEHGYTKIADVLVKLGLSVNEADDSGDTPLMTACAHKEMVEYLISQGADIKAKNKKGQTLFPRYLNTHLLSNEMFHEILELILNSTHTNVALEAVDILKSSTGDNETPLVLQIINRMHNLPKKTTDMLCNKCGVEYQNKIEQKSLLHAISSYGADVKSLIEDGADINCKNENMESALHLAARHNKTELVEYFTKLGLSVNDQCTNGNTPLHMVRTLRSAKHLISCGADIFAKNKSGQIFAHIAAIWASEEEFAEVIDLYQKSSNNKTIFQIKDEVGETILHSRLKADKIDKFTLDLLQNDNVDVTLKDQYGDTLLFLLASTNNHWDVVKKLIQSKSNINARGKYNRNLLHIAASKGNIEMIDYFVSLGLSIHQRDHSRNTPMHLAYHNLETVKHLCNLGADVKAQNQAGETILHLAANSKDDLFEQLALFLLKDCKIPAIFRETNCQKRTAIHVRLLQKQRIPFYLLDLILSIPHFKHNQKDMSGNTILNAAIIGDCDVETVKLLVHHGVDLYETNEQNQTALHLAVEQGNLNLVNYLLSMKADVLKRDALENSSIQKPFQGSFQSPYQNWVHCQILDKLLHNLLIDKNISTLQDSSGNTFLHTAALENKPDCFHKLVEWLGIQGYRELFHVKNKRMQLPLQVAVSRTKIKLETLKIFQKYGPFMNSTDGKGRSLLHNALRKVKIRKSRLPLGWPEPDVGRDLSDSDRLTTIMNLIEVGVYVSLQSFNGNTFMHLFAKRRYGRYLFTEMIKKLRLVNEENVLHIRNKLGQSCFNIALYKTGVDTEVLKILKEISFDFNTVDHKNKTLLMYSAVGSKRLDIISKLIDYGVDVMAQDHQGNTFVHYVSKHWYGERYQDFLRFLVKSGLAHMLLIKNNRKKTPFFIAVHYGIDTSPETINLCLEILKSVTFPKFDTEEVLNQTDIDGVPLLFCAVMEHKSLTLVKYLVDLGANYKYVDIVHVCALNGLVEHLKYFNCLGCLITSHDGRGNNALHYAATFNYFKKIHGHLRKCSCNINATVDFLIENGCSKNQINANGETPYAVGIKYGMPFSDVLEKLV